MLKKSYPSTVSAPVAFIGLGTMGYPMAGHLQKAGHEVCASLIARRRKQWLGKRSS